MSTLWMDSLDLYGSGTPSSANMGRRGYTANQWDGMYIGGGGRWGGYKIRMSNVSSKLKYYFGSDAPYPSYLWIVGCYVQWRESPGATSDCIEIGRIAGELSESINCAMRRGTDGSIKIYDSNGSNVASSAASVITLNTWYYIEFKVFTNNSTGYAVVRVNGVEKVSATDIDTWPAAGAANEVRWKAQSHGNDMYFDDFVVFSGDGEAWEIRDFIGPKRIWTAGPNADTAQEDWDRSTGEDSYALIDDPAPGVTQTSTYLSTDAGLEETIVQVANLSGLVNPVCVSTVLAGGWRASGTIGVNHIVKSGGTKHYSTPDILDTTWIDSVRFWPRDPKSGGVPWTDSGLSAAEIGLKSIEYV